MRLYLAFYLTKDDSFKSHYIEISVADDVQKVFHLISTCKIHTSSSKSVMLESESTSNPTPTSPRITNTFIPTTTTNNDNDNTCSSLSSTGDATNNLFATTNNEFLLCDSFPKNQNYTHVKISIKASNSSLIRVKSVRILGVKRDANKQQTVKDASVCWFFDILSSMALLQSQLVPSMYNNLLNISK